jgi:hypothetical protein
MNVNYEIKFSKCDLSHSLLHLGKQRSMVELGHIINPLLHYEYPLNHYAIRSFSTNDHYKLCFNMLHATGDI